LNPRCNDSPPPQFLHALEQFNRGKYWHQHETLEVIWRGERDESIRNFYKGILQGGVGLHHLTRRNYNGAVKVLVQGIAYLEPYAPRCMGVDVARLIAEACAVLARVQVLGAERIGEIKVEELPRVH
jgi:predicted metal-dependent hydrolase